MNKFASNDNIMVLSHSNMDSVAINHIISMYSIEVNKEACHERTMHISTTAVSIL